MSLVSAAAGSNTRNVADAKNIEFAGKFCELPCELFICEIVIRGAKSSGGKSDSFGKTAVLAILQNARHGYGRDVGLYHWYGIAASVNWH
jgi:hypothetical protein